ncbi:MAG: choice-of-anchor E domain-containing protein [Chloroflexota bacterium]
MAVNVSANAQTPYVQDVGPVCEPLSFIRADNPNVLLLTPFDTTLGVLDSVQYTVTVDMDASVTITNTDLGLQVFEGTYIAQVDASLPDGSTTRVLDTDEDFMTPQLDEDEGHTLVFADFNTLSGQFTNTIPIEFIGPASLSLPITARAATSFFAGPNFDLMVRTTAEACVELRYVYRVPSIEIEKSTNGSDADEPTGPQILAGDPVTWTYQITNTGTITHGVPFSAADIQILDSDVSLQINRDLSTDANSDDILSMGESWTYLATGTATQGQYTNVGTVIGTVPVLAGIITPTITVSDTDPSHYFSITPAIDIEKSTNGQDADSVTGPLVAAGGQVTWTYVITNTGNVTLTNIGLTDDVLGLIGAANFIGSDQNSDGLLSVNESWTYQTTGTAITGQYTNTGTVTGDAPNVSVGPGMTTTLTVSDTDPSHYFGVSPSIELEKATNGEDADRVTGPLVESGGLVTWTYVITNTGNVTLTHIGLTDDRIGAILPANFVGPDLNNDGLLSVNESWTYQATGTAITGQYTNTGTVTGDTPNLSTGPNATTTLTVSDTDPSHYFGVSPLIDLEKATNGVDADTVTGPLVGAGEIITWSYVITNTGNVTLTDIALTDDVLGVISPANFVGPDLNNDGLLSINESWTYQTAGTSITGQYTNTGSVTGTTPDLSSGPGMTTTLTVSDSDPSHYFGMDPGIDVLKIASENQVAAGTPVTYTYTVSNTGNVPLTNITIADDTCSSVTPIVNGPANVGDVNQDVALDLTEQWLYNCVMPLFVDTTNVVTVTGEDPTGTPTTPVTDTETVDVLPTAILTKTADPLIVPEAGGNVTFTLEIENTSGEPLTLTVISDSVFGVIPDIAGTTCSVPQRIAPAGIYRCAFTQFLSGTAGEPHVNVATAQLTDDEGNSVSPSDDAWVDFDPPGSIAVTKTPNVTIVDEAGQDVVFTIVISNTGAADVATINRINDSVFGDVTILPNTTCSVPQQIPVAGAYTCTFTQLINGEIAQNDADGDDMVHTNVVTAEGVDESGNPLTDSDDAMVLINPPDDPNLTLEKVDTLFVDLGGDRMASPGDTVLYEIFVRNTGGLPATGVQLVDVVSIYTTIKPGQVVTSKGTVVEGNQIGDTRVVVNIGTVDPGETVTVTIRVAVESLASCATSIVNQATVTSTNAGEVTSGPIGSPIPLPTITLITGTDLEVRQSIQTPSTSSDGTPVARPGDVLQYTVEITNSVRLTATNVYLDVQLDGSVDLLLNSVTLNGNGPIAPNYDAARNQFVVAVDVLPPNSTAIINYSAQLATPLPVNMSPITNEVDIVYDFNVAGGQEVEPIIDPDRVDKCLVTGTGELPTNLEIVSEPEEEDDDERLEPVIFIPVL